RSGGGRFFSACGCATRDRPLNSWAGHRTSCLLGPVSPRFSRGNSHAVRVHGLSRPPSGVGGTVSALRRAEQDKDEQGGQQPLHPTCLEEDAPWRRLTPPLRRHALPGTFLPQGGPASRRGAPCWPRSARVATASGRKE